MLTREKLYKIGRMSNYVHGQQLNHSLKILKVLTGTDDPRGDFVNLPAGDFMLKDRLVGILGYHHASWADHLEVIFVGASIHAYPVMGMDFHQDVATRSMKLAFPLMDELVSGSWQDVVLDRLTDRLNSIGANRLVISIVDFVNDDLVKSSMLDDISQAAVGVIRFIGEQSAERDLFSNAPSLSLSKLLESAPAALASYLKFDDPIDILVLKSRLVELDEAVLMSADAPAFMPDLMQIMEGISDEPDEISEERKSRIERLVENIKQALAEGAAPTISDQGM